MLITISVSGQGWFPSDASWYYNQVIFGVGNTYRHLEVSGEAEIKGKVCKEIRGACQCSKYGGVNYLYQDGEQIFIYVPAADSFRVLYDFSLVAGEIFTVYGEDEGDSHFLIDSITMYQAGPISLRVQHIQWIDGYHQVGTKIYERIGANGCLYPVLGICDPGTAGLRCYEDAEVGLQKFIQPELACDYVTSVDDPDQKTKVKVFPNPVKDRLSIESTEAIVTIEFVHMATGKVFTSTGFNQTEFDIDISSMSSGAYILKLYAALGGVQIVKVILME